MTNPRFEAHVRRLVTRRYAALGEDLRHLREDAGVSRAAVARAAGVDAAFLGRIEDGREHPSLGTYVRLATALGADLSTRLYPSTGPAIRDRHQAAMLEGLLGVLHPRWQPFPEVAVRQPSRGWIDVALHEPHERLLVATELQSEMRRLEQLVRWSGQKAAALPSWDGWANLGGPAVSRLMIVRRTRTNRAVGDAYPEQLRTAFPAHPDDALAALAGTVPWPGPALVWAVVDGRGARLVGGR